MQRIFGIETEYGCLSLRENPRHSSDAWPRVVRNYLFDDMGVGVMDLHYRDYEEPPGNGGFLKNGGRIYLDLGHLEYATPECRSFFDIAMYDIAGDQTLVAAVHAMGANEDVTFIKNNIDHYTEATFGCHENYLIPRDPTLSSDAVGVLMSFLATRQIYAGTGRVGESLAVISSEEAPRLAEGAPPCNYQISQRADHIVNDIFRWVQFNRAIINARDEPLADNSKYRRLHLLLGDSNMSPYATALKVGTTHCVLTLLEAGVVPEEVILKDAVRATREVSRDLLLKRDLGLMNGSRLTALQIQWKLLELAETHFRTDEDREIQWLLKQWRFVLTNLKDGPERLLGGIDWITKKWLLDLYRSAEHVGWNHQKMKSLDLAYHHIDPNDGLYFQVQGSGEIASFCRRVSVAAASARERPPDDTRARGRGIAVRYFAMRNRKASKTGGPAFGHQSDSFGTELIPTTCEYVINWDSVACGTGSNGRLAMDDPFLSYEYEVKEYLQSLTE